MPQYCCVPLCKNSASGHRFPTKDIELRRKWIVAVKRVDPVTKKLWEPGECDRVCRDHFTDDDYTSTLMGERRRLKNNAVPSKFDFIPVRSPAAVRRAERKRKREEDREMEIIDIEDVGNEVEIGWDTAEKSEDVIEPSAHTSTSVDTECYLLNDMNSKFSIENFRDNPRAVKYYTGMQHYDHFMFMMNVLGPAAYNLKYRCSVLSPENQFFLT